MADAERQRRRHQRQAAEQPWDAADEAERIKLRLKSRGLNQKHLQELAAALDGRWGPNRGSKQRARPTPVTSNVKASVIWVAGAPGDGARALATAMEQELVSRGVELSGGGTVGAYRVQALVLWGQARNRQRSLHVAWTLADPSGKKLGNVEQYNEVPEGPLDGVWRSVARYAAPGIVMLISQ
jgi:hypothetical protein